jgi:hypothetical protein
MRGNILAILIYLPQSMKIAHFFRPCGDGLYVSLEHAYQGITLSALHYY